MKITSFLSKNGRIQVFVDEKYSFSTTSKFILENRLELGEISEDNLNLIKANAQESILRLKFYEYATKGLNSPFELSNKIQKYSSKKFNTKVDQKMINKFVSESNKLLIYNESNIVENLINLYISRSKSENYIKQKLLSKKFNKELVTEQLTKISKKSVDNNLQKILERKLEKIKNKYSNTFEIKNKLIQFASSKGFKYSDIKSALENLDLK